MPLPEFRLKQASAVLGVDSKALQNLVQMKVLNPPRRDNFYWFDTRLLLEAKLAFYLKETLGSSSEWLAQCTKALSQELLKPASRQPRYLRLQSTPAKSQEALEIRIPLRQLAKELEEQLPRAEAAQDLPRGRKRPGWKRELTRSLNAAASDLSGITESQIAAEIRAFRNQKKRLPEISIGHSAGRS